MPQLREEPLMKRLMLLAVGVALATVPAVLGLTHNPALSHSVPVHIRSDATPTPTPDASGQGALVVAK
jgi:hypothetical protein